jgi:hypothetical protein
LRQGITMVTWAGTASEFMEPPFQPLNYQRFG